MGMSQEVISFDEKDKLSAAIKAKRSFSVCGANGVQSVAAQWLEREIEQNGMRCRIFTSKRKAVLAGAFLPSGVTQVGALVAGVGMIAHNLATLNPDYEICKNALDSGITVTYKKV